MSLLAGSRGRLRTEVRVLGPVVALRDGDPVALGGPQQLRVLAVLIAHGPVVVSRDALVDQVWADTAPARAANAVQVYVSQLRSVLGRDCIVTEGGGYRLGLPGDAVDAWRFGDLVARGVTELSAGRAGDALALFTDAVETWRGNPFQSLDDIEVLADEADRLRGLLLVAEEGRLEAAVTEGRHAHVLPELVELVRKHPLREHGWALLMRAQYAAGRQADALETYARARSILAEELGIDPGPELRGLEEAVLRQDPVLGAADEFLPPLPEGLSATGPPFVGRESELAWLSAGLDLVSTGGSLALVLHGEPGIGKTRLMAEFARLAQSRRIPVSYTEGAGCLLAPVSVVGTCVRVFDGVETIPGAAAPELAAALEAPRPGCLDIYCLATANTALPIRVVLSRLAVEEDRERVLGPLTTVEVEHVARMYDSTADKQHLNAFASAVGMLSPREAHEAASAWAMGRASDRVRAAAAAMPQARVARDRLLSRLVDAQHARERRHTNLAALATVQPYVGLMAYDEGDASIFFGRDHLVARLLERLMTSGLVVVAGASGMGKSSLVRAGVVPAIAAGSVPGGEEWQCLVTTPARLDGDADQQRFLSTESQAPRLLVLDQLEEAFTSLSADEISELTALLMPVFADERTRVVATVRSDFLDQAANWQPLRGSIVDHVVVVGPMSKEELRRVIEQPAILVGARFEGGLPERILRDAGSEPGVLPLLSTVLLALWERGDGTKLTHAAYDASGGLHGAINRLAEQTYATLRNDEAGVARRILLRLADVDDDQTFVRRRRTIDQVAAPGDTVGLRVLHHLASDRLLVIDRGAVEVAHEALLTRWTRLSSWLEADVDARRTRDQIVQATETWRQGGRLASDLFRGQRLVAAHEFAVAHADELTDDEREFLAGSQAQADAERGRQRRSVRRLRVLAAVLSLLVLVAGVSAWTAVRQRDEAQGQRRAAEASALRADARRMAVQATQEVSPDLALLLAAHAVQLDENADTRSALMSVLTRTDLFAGRLLAGGSSVERVAVSPGGEIVAARNIDGGVTILDAATGRSLATINSVAPPCTRRRACFSLEFSPDGNFLALSGLKGFHIVDVSRSGMPVVSVLPIDTDTVGGTSVEFVGDGAVAYVSGQLWDLHRGRRLLHPSWPKRRVCSSCLSKEGQLSRLADGRLVIETFRHAEVLDTGSLEVGPLFGRLQRDETIRYTRRGHPTASISLGPFTVSRVSPDGRFVARGAGDGRVAIWDLEARRRIGVTEGHHGPVTSVAWSPDSSSFATSGVDGLAVVWSAPGLARQQELRGHSESMWDLVFSPDGRTLYTASRDGTVLRWDLTGAGRLAPPFLADPYPGPERMTLMAAQQLQPGPRGAVAITLTVVDVSSLKPEQRTPAYVWSSDLPRRVVVLLCPTQADQCTHPIRLRKETKLFTSVSERTLLVREPTEDASRPQWEWLSPARDGAEPSLATYPSQDYPKDAYADSEDGRLVLTDTPSGTTVWDLDTQAAAGPAVSRGQVNLQGDRSALGLLSPDGTLIIGDDQDAGTFAVIEVSTGRRVSPEMEIGQAHWVWTRFSPDGKLLAVLTQKGIEFRDTRTWDLVPMPVPQRSAQAYRLEFSPSGRALLTAGDDGVLIWDLTAAEPTSIRLPLEGAFYDADFLSEDRVITVNTESGDYRTWHIDTKWWIDLACSRAGRELTDAEWDSAWPGRDDVPSC